jgi:hypothetical protein
LIIVAAWPSFYDFNYHSTVKMLHEKVRGHSTFAWKEFEGPHVLKKGENNIQAIRQAM